MAHEEVLEQVIPRHRGSQHERRGVRDLLRDLDVTQLLERTSEHKIQCTGYDGSHTVLQRMDIQLNSIHYLHELAKDLVALRISSVELNAGKPCGNGGVVAGVEVMGQEVVPLLGVPVGPVRVGYWRHQPIHTPEYPQLHFADLSLRIAIFSG